MAKEMAQITRMGVLYLSFLFILIFWTTDNGLQTTDKVATEREQRLLAGSAERSNFNEVNRQRTTDNRHHSDGIHPEGCLLSVVSSPLSSFYQSTFFSTIAERAGIYSLSHSFL